MEEPSGSPARTRWPNKAQRQLLIIGLVAMLLPLCLLTIILVVNFGGRP
jgi:TRAP-type mannitol/chloroaromatic compound transport system permease small subunit